MAALSSNDELLRAAFAMRDVLSSILDLVSRKGIYDISWWLVTHGQAALSSFIAGDCSLDQLVGELERIAGGLHLHAQEEGESE